MATLLLVSPDGFLISAVHQHLGARGHAVVQCRSAAEVRRAFQSVAIEVLVIDVTFGLSELEKVLTSLFLTLPIILVASPGKRAEALLLASDVGIRSHVVTTLEKPVSLAALEQALPARAASPSVMGEVAVGPFRLDPSEGQFQCGEVSILLTPMESRLVHYLLSRPQEAISVEELLERVWGFHPGTGTPEIVRAHIANVRQKLRAVGPFDLCIETLRRRGYRFACALPTTDGARLMWSFVGTED